MLVIKWHHPIIEDLTRGDRGLAIVEFGKGNFGVGIDEGLLVDPPDTLQRSDIEGVPAPRNSADTRCRTRHAPACPPWPSRVR